MQPSPALVEELDALKTSVGFNDETERYRQLAGNVLQDQTQQIVQYCRGGIIASIPNLARYSRSLKVIRYPNI